MMIVVNVVPTGDSSVYVDKHQESNKLFSLNRLLFKKIVCYSSSRRNNKRKQTGDAIMSKIINVSLNHSDYRRHDFDSPHPRVHCERWQIDFKMESGYTKDDIESGEDEFVYGVTHFTTYGVDSDNKQAAYKFFVKLLSDLIECYILGHGEPSEVSPDPFSVPCFDEALNDDGFPLFDQLYTHTPVCGSLKEMIDRLDKPRYIYYSSMKLLSYTFHDNSCENQIFEYYRDILNFIENPPELIEELPHSTY